MLCCVSVTIAVLSYLVIKVVGPFACRELERGMGEQSREFRKAVVDFQKTKFQSSEYLPNESANILLLHLANWTVYTLRRETPLARHVTFKDLSKWIANWLELRLSVTLRRSSCYPNDKKDCFYQRYAAFIMTSDSWELRSLELQNNWFKMHTEIVSKKKFAFLSCYWALLHCLPVWPFLPRILRKRARKHH